jgi:hypothetical protein
MGSWGGSKMTHFSEKEVGERFPKSRRFRKSDAEVGQPTVTQVEACGFGFFVFGDEVAGEGGHGGEEGFTKGKGSG